MNRPDVLRAGDHLGDAGQPSAERRPVAVYAWTTGQDFNIGDSLLRRPYLRHLAELGPLHVYVRNASPAFITGLGIEGLTPRRSFARWYVDLCFSALTRKTVVALNAGEMRITTRRACLVASLALASLACRLRGGGSVWLGASVLPTQRRFSLAAYRLAARTATVVRWREAGSSCVVAARPVGPDWAFAEGSHVDDWHVGGRDVAAFVLRGDRDSPSPAWCQWARQVCASLDLQPVFVVQVRIDKARAAAMAALLGGGSTVVGWPEGATHAQQEAEVRAVFKRALIVIGDRLHGLIVGATEGAVPIGWVESSRGKVAAHFDAVSLPFVGEFEGEKFSSHADLDRSHVTQLEHELSAAMTVIREELALTREVLLAI